MGKALLVAGNVVKIPDGPTYMTQPIINTPNNAINLYILYYSLCMYNVYYFRTHFIFMAKTLKQLFSGVSVKEF